MPDETITETPVPVTRAETITPNFAELMSTNVDLAAQMREFIQAQVEAGMKNAMAQLQRKSHIAELCQRLTGGDSDHAWGLPVKEGDLSDVLLSLDDASREKVEGLLTRIHEAGLVDFAETGHAKNLKGLTQLADPIKRELRKALDKGWTIEQFFSTNQHELGPMLDYDLNEFQAKEK